MKVAKRVKRTLSRRLSRSSLGNLRRKLALVRQRDLQALALRCSTAELLARQYRPWGFNRLDVVVMYLALGEACGCNPVGFSLLAKLLERDRSRRKSDRAFQLFLQAADPSQEVCAPLPVRVDSEMNVASSPIGLAVALFKGDPEVAVTLTGKLQPSDYDAGWFQRHGFSADEIATLERARRQIFDGLRLRSVPWDEVVQLHQEMRQLLDGEPQRYGRQGFYQSCEALLLPGQRPTALRFGAYGFPRLLSGSERVLDIGCNCGFFALAIARHVAAVDAFDVNPSLIRIAQLAQRHLEIANCRFRVSSFEDFTEREPYDLILSFAVHHWIGVPMQQYVARLRRMLKPGGRVLLESHDLSSHDRDWEAKLAAVCGAGFEEVQSGILCDDGLFARRHVLLQRC